MELEQLPDDALLSVLRYLDLPALFACRLVSKRLGQLALHPDAWCHRWLTKHNRWTGAVLRLAPCVRGMLHELGDSSNTASAFEKSECAMEELQLCFRWTDSKKALAAVRQQAALGRLKTLVLLSGEISDVDHEEVLGPIALTPGLRNLIVKESITCAKSAPVSSSSVSESSLVKFSCCNSLPGAEQFVHLVLSTHAATLEEVDLGLRASFYPLKSPAMTSVSTSTQTAALLAAIPKLRKLRCPLLPGMEAVAACPSLHSLTLTVTGQPPRDLVASAAQLLRRASQLRDVELLHTKVAADCSEELLGALAACKDSRLEMLSVSGRTPTLSTLLRVLPRTLPALPPLRRLVVQSDAEELLRCITPASAPGLRSLGLDPPPSLNDLPCGHSWAHRTSVRKLLAVNPALELFVSAKPMFCKPSLSPCRMCARGCQHPQLDESDKVDHIFNEWFWKIIPRI